MVKICPERLGKYMLKNRSLFTEETIDFSFFVVKVAPSDPLRGPDSGGCARLPAAGGSRAAPGAGARDGRGAGSGVAPRSAPLRAWEGELVNGRKRTVIAHLHMLLIVDLGIFYEYSFTKQMLFKKRGNIILWAMN